MLSSGGEGNTYSYLHFSGRKKLQKMIRFTRTVGQPAAQFSIKCITSRICEISFKRRHSQIIRKGSTWRIFFLFKVDLQPSCNAFWVLSIYSKF